MSSRKRTWIGLLVAFFSLFLSVAAFGVRYAWKEFQRTREQSLRLEVRPEVEASLGIAAYPAKEVPEEIRYLIERYAKRDLDVNFARHFFDHQRMIEQLNALFPGGRLTRNRLDEFVDSSMRYALQTMILPQNWDKAKITGLLWHVEGVEGVLHTQHVQIDEDQVETPFAMR